MPETTMDAPRAGLLARARMVRKLRDRLALLTATREELLAHVKEENAPLFEEIETLNSALTHEYDALREEAKAYYEATGVKAPVPGVGIRVSTKLAYAMSDAVAWAELHAPVMVRIEKVLDTGTFDTLMKSMPEVERPLFVMVDERVTATISPDNAKLPEPEDPDA